MIPARSASKPRLISRDVSPLLGLTVASRARPQRISSPLCQMDQSNKKKARVVSESPGPRPRAREELAAMRPPMLLNSSTPITTTARSTWDHNRSQPIRRRAAEMR